MKKILFVALVLFGSLILLQYVLLQGVVSPVASPEPDNKIELIQPVKNQMFDAGDYIVVIKDGKYFVVEKSLPST